MGRYAGRLLERREYPGREAGGCPPKQRTYPRILTHEYTKNRLRAHSSERLTDHPPAQTQTTQATFRTRLRGQNWLHPDLAECGEQDVPAGHEMRVPLWAAKVLQRKCVIAMAPAGMAAPMARHRTLPRALTLVQAALAARVHIASPRLHRHGSSSRARALLVCVSAVLLSCPYPSGKPSQSSCRATWLTRATLGRRCCWTPRQPICGRRIRAFTSVQPS